MMIRKTIPAALLLSLFLVQSLCADAPRKTKTILILYSEDKDHPAHELTDRGIREALQSDKRFDVRLYTEYLDLSRFAAPSHRRNVAKYLAGKYADTKVDVIITVYPAAVDLLREEARDAFSRTPIIACTVTKSYVNRLDGLPMRESITGTTAGQNSALVLDSAFEMMPDTKRIALVSGKAPNDSYGERVFLRTLKDYSGGPPELIDLTKLSMADTLERVATLPPHTIVYYESITIDASDKIFVPREALSMISKAANAPVFGLYDSYLGYGIVGGQLVSFEQQGRIAAQLALRVLSGESPGSIPFQEQGSYVNLYDWRQLKRWGIPESAVPPGSEIRYRERSLWEDHAAEIFGLAFLLMVETGLIVGLVRNLRKRRNTERSLMESEDRVKLALSSAGAGLWSLDNTSGAMWVTDEVRKILGAEYDEKLCFEKFLALIHTEDRDQVLRAMQDASQSGQETRIEHRIALPDGRVRWIASVGRVRPAHSSEDYVLTGVSVDITQQKQTKEKLRESEKELSLLAGRLISAQEEERSRVARELHDDFTQRLAVLAIDAGTIELQQESRPTKVREALGKVKTGLVKMSQDIHDLSRQLHPSILEDLGLIKAVQSECARLSRKEGLEVYLTHENVPDTVPRDVSLALYRIIQEGLRNIVTHSRAKTAHLFLKGADNAIELSIRDTGVGFDSSKTSGKPGLGISSMEERTKLVHGEFFVDSTPGEGTVITVRTPLYRETL